MFNVLYSLFFALFFYFVLFNDHLVKGTWKKVDLCSIYLGITYH